MCSAASSQQRIVIVGGGTAGWLTANHLARALDEKFAASTAKPYSITLIESPNIPTVGVGEGTVPSIRDSLHYFGISESELIKRCSATFKQSIDFIGWQPPQSDGAQHVYQHIFDYPQIESEEALCDWINHGFKAANFADTFSVQSHLVQAGLAPKKFIQAEFHGVCNYAYHFDAAKFSELLAENATQRLGVDYQQLEIAKGVKNNAGGIAYLLTENGQRIEAELFIDCSGGRSLLLGQCLETEFISKADEIFTDTAIATQVAYSSIKKTIACATLATAHRAGWIWDIGLVERRGVGIVYSSQHMTEADARETLAHYIGLEDQNNLLTEPRKIPMRSGHYAQFWRNNCVAIGMSQGFVEPLEATGLLMFDKTAQLLAQMLSEADSTSLTLSLSSGQLQRRFNQQLCSVWEGVFDFIKLHYCLSQRDDSDFWRAHRDMNTWSPQLIQMLTKWHTQLPSQIDLRPGVFNLANHLYVLLGMDVRPLLNTNVDNSDGQLSGQQRSIMQAHLASLNKVLMPHRELIEKVHEYGLQRI
ncbi:tryptophan 7-halogenase [Alteromonas sp. ASW11-36]|uniref:Tryptophan 7-halogenase n=1 Tax=Alteromonas arenosi TaxID=3055817 RepID=A0ABT7SSG8_9ALTE|nr:tryptophan halogenase family protein [Alteromonas sp. ASW11-36]MDM7859101.1 tryptophan 7-halogenase [Alteromonas sp. ASW11-36]